MLSNELELRLNDVLSVIEKEQKANSSELPVIMQLDRIKRDVRVAIEVAKMMQTELHAEKIKKFREIGNIAYGKDFSLIGLKYLYNAVKADPNKFKYAVMVNDCIKAVRSIK